MLHKDETVLAAAFGDDDETIPEQIFAPDGTAIATVKYVRTDAWRGHYDTDPIEGSGWERIDEGWVTGNWDDAPAGCSADEVEAKLEEYARDAEVVVVGLPTSNVFSTAYDVYRRAA